VPASPTGPASPFSLNRPTCGAPSGPPSDDVVGPLLLL